MSNNPELKNAIDIAKNVITVELDALSGLLQQLDDGFVAASRLCLHCEGRIIVTGMGKSGHIGGKIAATLASTGSPAFFVHPGEASHGDLGMITTDDLVLAISNSGETDEIITILPLIKRLGVPLITMTGGQQSTLAKAADAILNTSVDEEACPLNLAPTASTTCALAMGDALAVVLLKIRGFTEEDFARSHPGGKLGKRLLLRVEDIMRSGDAAATVRADTMLRDGLFEISEKGLGMTTIVDDQQRVLGVFTDGDLRRSLDDGADINTTRMHQVMHENCVSVRPSMLAAEAVRLLEEHKITALVVADSDNTLLGILHVHDMLRAGVM